jgi:hypothetical protein
VATFLKAIENQLKRNQHTSTEKSNCFTALSDKLGALVAVLYEAGCSNIDYIKIVRICLQTILKIVEENSDFKELPEMSCIADLAVRAAHCHPLKDFIEETVHPLLVLLHKVPGDVTIKSTTPVDTLNLYKTFQLDVNEQLPQDFLKLGNPLIVSSLLTL